MIPKIVGFIFAMVGGFFLGVGLLSEFVMPLLWWLLTLLFICIGIMGVFFFDREGD